MPKKNEELAGTLQEHVRSQLAFKDSTWNEYFSNCDRYYHGFRHNAEWPDGKKRSNIKLNAAADIAETLYSKLLFTLFYAGGENFFDFESVDTKVARANTDRLRYLLNTPYSVSGKTSFFALKRGLRYVIRYGIGATEIAYNDELGRPVLQEVSIRDILWDPSFSPFIDDSEFITRKGFLTLSRLKSYRGLPGYNIPSDKKLADLISEYTPPEYDNADMARADAVIGAIGSDVSGVTSYDTTRESRFRIYRITTSEKVYWLTQIGPEPIVIFEGRNRVGFQPYAFGFYRTLLEAFGGRSLVDIVSGDHDAQQKAVNSMFDIMDLNVMRPRTVQQGSEKTHPWSPGSLSKSANPRDEQTADIRFPPELMALYEQSRQRMNRDAGTNDMAIHGVPTPSNANRTLGGMRMQSASDDARDFATTTELEEIYIAPALTKLLMADATLTPAESRNLGLGRTEKGSSIQNTVDPENLDPLTTITLRGATRMVGIQRLAGMVQPVMQHMFDPQVQAAAALHGFAPNFDEYNDFFHEATGTTRKFNFYSRMSPEQQQQLQSQKLQGDQMKAQSRQQSDELRSQTQVEIERLKQAGLSEKLIVEILKALPALMEGASNGPHSSASAVPEDSGTS